jgi:hypothetical protein
MSPIEQGLWTGIGTGAAEGAFTFREVDTRKSAGERHDDFLWASGQALAATGTVVHEAMRGEPRQSHMDGIAAGLAR